MYSAFKHHVRFAVSALFFIALLGGCRRATDIPPLTPSCPYPVYLGSVTKVGEKPDLSKEAEDTPDADELDTHINDIVENSSKHVVYSDGMTRTTETTTLTETGAKLTFAIREYTFSHYSKEDDINIHIRRLGAESWMHLFVWVVKIGTRVQLQADADKVGVKEKSDEK